MESIYEKEVCLVWRKNPGEEPTILQAWDTSAAAHKQLDYLRENRHPSVAFWIEYVSVFNENVLEDVDYE
jgi:hypothetical protein